MLTLKKAAGLVENGSVLVILGNKTYSVTNPLFNEGDKITLTYTETDSTIWIVRVERERA